MDGRRAVDVKLALGTRGVPELPRLSSRLSFMQPRPLTTVGLARLSPIVPPELTILFLKTRVIVFLKS